MCEDNIEYDNALQNEHYLKYEGRQPKLYIQYDNDLKNEHYLKYVGRQPKI